MTEVLGEAVTVTNALTSDTMTMGDDQETAQACAKQGELFIH